MWNRARGCEKWPPLLIPAEYYLPKGIREDVVSKSLWLDSKGQSSEQTQPLKQKKELMLAVPVQLNLIINYNNYTALHLFFLVFSWSHFAY